MASIFEQPVVLVVWHTRHHLADHSFWTIEPVDSDSWACKQLLKLCPKAESYYKPYLKNAKELNFGLILGIHLASF